MYPILPFHQTIVLRSLSYKFSFFSLSRQRMQPPTIPSPHRFGLYLCLSLIALLILFYTNLCMSPAYSCPGIFHRDFTFSFKVQLHWAHPSTDDADDNATITSTSTPRITAIDSTKNNKNNTTSTPLNKDLRVDNLYQYALTSPRVRTDKDRRKLRRYLLEN